MGLSDGCRSFLVMVAVRMVCRQQNTENAQCLLAARSIRDAVNFELLELKSRAKRAVCARHDAEAYRDGRCGNALHIGGKHLRCQRVEGSRADQCAGQILGYFLVGGRRPVDGNCRSSQI